MARAIFLDAGVIGLLCSSPSSPEVRRCYTWLARMDPVETIVVLPDITLYEVRRELVRIDAAVKLDRLDTIRTTLKTAPVTSEAWQLAGEFWALVRKAGIPTADPHTLDADAILAAAAATFPGPGEAATIATTNVVHLARFPGIDARRWESVA